MFVVPTRISCILVKNDDWCRSRNNIFVQWILFTSEVKVVFGNFKCAHRRLYSGDTHRAVAKQSLNALHIVSPSSPQKSGSPTVGTMLKPFIISIAPPTHSVFWRHTDCWGSSCQGYVWFSLLCYFVIIIICFFQIIIVTVIWPCSHKTHLGNLLYVLFLVFR